MMRFSALEEMMSVERQELARRAERGERVKQAIELSQADRVSVRVRVGRSLVRLGGRLQGEHAPRALREVLTDC